MKSDLRDSINYSASGSNLLSLTSKLVILLSKLLKSSADVNFGVNGGWISFFNS